MRADSVIHGRGLGTSRSSSQSDDNRLETPTGFHNVMYVILKAINCYYIDKTNFIHSAILRSETISSSSQDLRKEICILDFEIASDMQMCIYLATMLARGLTYTPRVICYVH